MNTTKLSPLFLRIAFLCVVLVALFGIAEVATDTSNSPLAIAHRIVAECGKKAGTDHSLCYEAEVPSLYPAEPLSVVFDVVREIRKQDPTYQFCHVLAHKLGEAVVAQDPSHWMEAMALNPADGLCSNGFIHGVIGGRFRSEVLDDATLTKFTPDFARACEPRDSWNPTDLDRSICYHGMGHLFVFVTDADLPKALSLCSRITPGNEEQYRQVCISGVFMQIYQPLEPDDYYLISKLPVKLSRETVPAFCASFKNPEYVGACLSESLALSWSKLSDGAWVESFCSSAPDSTEQEHCFETAFSFIGRMSLTDPARAEATCTAFSPTHQSNCFSYVARVVLEEDHTAVKKAVALCAAAPTPEVRSACMQFLIDMGPFLFGSNHAQSQALCLALPDPYATTCMMRL